MSHFFPVAGPAARPATRPSGSRPVRRKVPLAALALGALLLAACGGGSAGGQDKAGGGASPSSSSSSTRRTITTTATGVATGVPDNVVVDVSIVSGGSSAAKVMTDNNQRTQKVIDQLGFSGTDDKDVSTTAVNLGPTYDKNGKITGYLATNSLELTLRDMKTAGKKLDLLIQGGDDFIRVSSFRLGFNDDDDLLGTARADAVKRAKAQADEMAAAAGAKVARVRTITESPARVPYANASRAAFDGAAAADSVPIAPGSQELNVQVKVVFELA